MDDDDGAVPPVLEVGTHGFYCELVGLQLVLLLKGDTETREGGRREEGRKGGREGVSEGWREGRRMELGGGEGREGENNVYELSSKYHRL